MQIHPTDLGVAGKICVEREYRHLMFVRQRADQKVDVRPLHATRSALIEEAGRALVGGGVCAQVIERAELVPKPVKLSRGCNAAQNLLADAAHSEPRPKPAYAPPWKSQRYRRAPKDGGPEPGDGTGLSLCE